MHGSGSADESTLPDALLSYLLSWLCPRDVMGIASVVCWRWALVNEDMSSARFAASTSGGRQEAAGCRTDPPRA